MIKAVGGDGTRAWTWEILATEGHHCNSSCINISKWKDICQVNNGHPWSLDLYTVLSLYLILPFLSYGFSYFQQWICIIFEIRTKQKLINKINTTVFHKLPQKLKRRRGFLCKWFSAPKRKPSGREWEKQDRTGEGAEQESDLSWGPALAWDPKELRRMKGATELSQHEAMVQTSVLHFSWPSAVAAPGQEGIISRASPGNTDPIGKTSCWRRMLPSALLRPAQSRWGAGAPTPYVGPTYLP